MKIIKQMIIAFMCVIFAIGGCVSAYAADNNVGVSPKPSYINQEGITTYGTKEPKQNWNLSTKGRYNFSGVAENNSLFSNYKLTGVSRAKISVYNYSSETLYMSVLKDGLIFNQTIQSNQIAGNTTSKPVTFYVNLDSSSKYILFFEAPCNFKGYIEKA